MMRVETATERIVAVRQEGVEDSQPPPRWGFDERRRAGISEPVLAALEGVARTEGETLRGWHSPFADPSRSPAG